MTHAEETENQNNEDNRTDRYVKGVVLPSESDHAQNNSCHRCRDEQQQAQLDNTLRRKFDSPLHDSHDGPKSSVAGMKMSVVRDRAEDMLAQ